MPKYSISMPIAIRKIADRLAEERGIGLSALISLLIFEKEGERVQVPLLGQVKPVGRPRHTAEDKEVTRWIERAERFSTYWGGELEGTEGLFSAMFGELQAKLDKAIEERDAPTLRALADGHEWQEVQEAYWKKVEEEDRNGNS